MICAPALVKMGRLENLPCSFQLHSLTAKYLRLLWAIECSLGSSAWEVTAAEENQVRRKGRGLLSRKQTGFEGSVLAMIKIE